MFYERDFTRIRDRINKLQIFSRKLHNRAERRAYFQRFADKFTLHGFCYIFDRNAYNFERCFWTALVITAMISSIYVCSMLSTKYNDRTLITVVEDSQYPVFNVEFPSIAICLTHRVNWARFEQAKRKFLPRNATNDTQEMFTSFVKRLDSMQLKSFDFLAGLEEEPLHLIDSLSVSRIATYLAYRCEEVIYGTCIWAGQPFDCCKMFIQERTSMGLCLVFNSVISMESRQKAISDEFYPFRISKNGEGSGLIFTVKRNTSNLVPGVAKVTGIDIMVKKPDQFTDEKTYHLRTNTYNGIMVKPEITRTDHALRSFPKELRKCLFSDEKSNNTIIPELNYRQWNCRALCYQQNLVRYCNCTIPLFFAARGKQERECTASDYICIYKNRDVFSNDRATNMERFIKKTGRGMACECPINCNSVNYYVTLNPIPIYNASDTNTTIHIDVYYQSEVMMRYLTMLDFTTLDLIGYFGGLLTLFLGASIISVLELLHLGLVELASYLREKNERKRNTMRAKAGSS